MPRMSDWTPEMREAAQAKAKETRDRKRAEKDARKAGREAKPTRRASPISKERVKHAVSLLVVGVDAALAYGAPQMWVTPEDRLNEREVEILTEAFSTEAMKSQRALRLLAGLTAFSDRLGIAGALMIVALPRLTRRGLIPQAWVPVIRDLIGSATAAPEPGPEPEREPEIPQREEPGPDRAAA